MIAKQIDDVVFDKDKIIGCIYLMAAVNAATLGHFLAPMSLCTITSFIRVIIIALFQLVQVYDLEWDWPLISVRDLIGCSLLGSGVAGACLTFNGWAMKKRGPVLS
ncbi:hypothetical protein PTKIN_Ptkin02bG0103500 [Pterospermum kingtungense]